MTIVEHADQDSQEITTIESNTQDSQELTTLESLAEDTQETRNVESIVEEISTVESSDTTSESIINEVSTESATEAHDLTTEVDADTTTTRIPVLYDVEEPLTDYDYKDDTVIDDDEYNHEYYNDNSLENFTSENSDEYYDNFAEYYDNFVDNLEIGNSDHWGKMGELIAKRHIAKMSKLEKLG
eukprot:TRINITY_DN127_c0_g2_i3.p1 TRINITY_DN127_c0_g2~~TRINITY_DN127_c0_g2_i3.p1  ORF type:complete len:197 (-),score=52.84 TRINITY_DN127_c0_g2_i3:149-700(-)